MARPVVSPLSEQFYERLEPYTLEEERLDYPLLTFVAGASKMTDEVAEWVLDSALGVGWSGIYDLPRTPTRALAYLAQFAGVRLRSGMPDLTQRERIRSTDGQRRGTFEAFSAAAKQYLTGTKYTIINERQGASAYRVAVRTLVSETPDSALVLAALLEQKPGGLILDYATTTGQTYDAVLAAFDTYSAVNTSYQNYGTLLANLPE
jgi:hypothetical protein